MHTMRTYLDTSRDPATLEMHTQLYATEYAGHWSRYNAQLLVNVGLLAAMTVCSQNPFVHAHLHVITIIGGEIAAIWLLLSILSARRVSAAAEALRRQLEAARIANGAQPSLAGRNRSILHLLSSPGRFQRSSC